MPRLLDLDLLRTFVAVVHNGSITAAANALHRTQSAISMQMQRLEEQVGCTLLLRKREGVTPTADGLWLLPKAQQLLALNDDVFAERKLARVAGLVRIGAAEHYATVVLPALLAQFCGKYPEVQFDLQIGIPSTMRPRLGMDYDLVIGMGPQGVAASSGVPGTTVLARSDAVWVCSPKHNTWRQRPLPLALQQEGSGVRAWAITALDGAGIPWRQACCCGNLTALENSVRAGLGVGVFMAQSISDRLRILGPDDGFPLLPRAEVWIAKADGAAPHATRLLHDFLVTEIRSRTKGSQQDR
ncbi:LysR substrate-binding domain-containing protein [Variovorax sp. J22R133]|uniref:LysR substrate-binding domain-containing protein n=1 Tax=Variovorax brevis TaxID=3053503 RepID=UPI0025774F45|nr:LysR substrate-binding domain-containing protein [Variovorax sp. J22R133]MDM0116312.1 LysR substrate-binding domain-containing protein [Variovorax sp. J22R133]